MSAFIMSQAESDCDKLCPIGKTLSCGYWHKQRKQIEQLQAELDKHRWIPVSEGLPEKRKQDPLNFSVEVLVIATDNFRSIGTYEYNDRIWRSGRNVLSETIAYWMYMPALKESEE